MMNITLTPQHHTQGETLTASVAGDVLTLNGVDFDFGQLEEGETLPGTAVQSDWIMGWTTITRTNGVICLNLISPYTGAGNQAQCYPAPLTNVEGVVPFPQPDPEPAEPTVTVEAAQ